MSLKNKLAIIGSGASAIYLLKHLLTHADFFEKYLSEISIFEKGPHLGMGMPYNPETTDQYNMANIPSEEMPPLLVSFADWLREQDLDTLKKLDIDRNGISKSKIYSRIALGKYLQNQYETIIAKLKKYDFQITEYPNCAVIDLREDSQKNRIAVIGSNGGDFEYDKVIVATGHSWPHEDRPELGYYGSPWPIAKLLPKPGTYLDHAVGTLGASLSAYDVISSLAHRHGMFVSKEEGMVYQPYDGTEQFKICMHAAHGRLPHLRYAIEDTERKIYRHVSRRDLLEMVNEKGFLRIRTYFDKVCRPALIEAFQKDSLNEIVQLLEDPKFSLEKFVEKMSAEHDYADAFEGMRLEMVEAKDSVLGHHPIYWKETIDDLIYTINFHAELMPAEDHLLLHSLVMPFLMNVIAAMPLDSGEKMMALHNAGILEIVSGKVSLPEDQTATATTTLVVENDGKKEVLEYRMFVDCSGQKPLELEEYPFPSLVKNKMVRKARVRFDDHENSSAVLQKKPDRIFSENGEPFYYTGGIDIDGTYRLIGDGGKIGNRIYDITFPHTSGVRPYSYGLQSCSDTGDIVVRALMQEYETAVPVDPDVSEVTQIYENV